MGKKSPPPPPDLKPISDAQLQISREANELAREYMGMSREQFAWFQENAREELEFAREQANRLFEMQDRAFESDAPVREMSLQVGQAQLDAMNQQMGFAEADRRRYEDVFLPMQDRFIQEAEGYDTPERREAEAARQMVDIQRQVEAQRSNADENLRSMGIDPSQMRSGSLLNQVQVMAAAQQAAAGNQGRQMIEDRGRALRADALNLGMGLPAQSAANFGMASTAGSGAMGAAGAGQGATLGALQGGAGMMGTGLGFRSGALNNVANLTGSPMQWAGMGGQMMGMQGSALNSAANTMNSSFANQMTNWNANRQNRQDMVGTAAMIGGMFMAEGGEVRRSRLDPGYTRAGQGSGEGGALGWRDRADNMALAAEAYQNTRGDDYVPMQPYSPMPDQFAGYYAEGGRALPVKQARDRLPAMLGEGEYVVPADVVRAVGLEKLDKMVAKYHRSNA